MSALRSILAIARVETQRLLRTPASLTLLLVVPILQLLLFGTAIRPDGASIPVAIAGRDPDGLVAASIARAPGLRLEKPDSPGDAGSALRSGRALVAIDLPAGRRPVRVTIDATDPALTAVAEARVGESYWHVLAQQMGVDELGPGIEVVRLHNPDGRSDWGFLPGLIGVTVMIGAVMLGTLATAREREAGTWETLLALPIGRAELLAGKALPYIVTGTVQGIVLLGLAIVLFDLPATGSIVALILLLPPFAAAHVVLGHALATRAANQIGALQGAIAFYLPAMLLSGFLYPFRTLPGWAQAIGSIFPLTHFIRAARGATLRGEGALAVLGHGVPILAFLVAVVALVLLGHRSRID